ncbi:MAG: succinylglutamate desuccinylase [Hahellaceae bacterium]|nr:succinylglutamate desuccinylase [Hahellaceae bacterium]
MRHPQSLDACPTPLSDAGLLAATLQGRFTSPCYWTFKAQRFTWLSEGILEIVPVSEAKHEALVLSAGIHGDETAPIEWVCNIVQGLMSGKIISTRPLLVILGHPAAMRVQRRYLDENLNRLFKPTLTQSQVKPTRETEVAHRLMTTVSDFHTRHGNFIHLDLHTAIRESLIEQFAIVPQSHPGYRWEEGLQLLGRCGIGAAVRQSKVSSTFSGWTHDRLNALSFTLELGKVAPFGENDLSRLASLDQAIRVQLTHTETDTTSANTAPARSETAPLPPVFEVAQEIIQTGESFTLEVAEDIPNFTRFDNGRRVWSDRNQFFQVENGPLYLLFPNPKVPKGQRAGLLIRRCE